MSSGFSSLLARLNDVENPPIMNGFILLSLFVETFNTNKVAIEVIITAINDNFDLTPKGIIESLNLKQPIYEKIIIAADEDPDGQHISSLLINFFSKTRY